MKSIIEQIDLWAINTPDTIAFQNSDYSLTYKTLKQQSDAIASWIVKNNFGNKPIIVYGHMQLDMISTFLGCVKAGCAYIPVDESIPFERLKKMITNSGATLLITPKEFSLEFEAIKVINLGELQKIIRSTNLIDSLTDFHVKDDETFYIIYTSGSTGDPKGVQITEKNLRSFSGWILKDFNLQKGQRFLNQAPFSFDLSVMDLYPSLLSGGTLIAVEKSLIERPKLLFDYLMERDLEVWTSTPSFIEMCMMNPDFNEAFLPKLKTFLFCGEVLSNNTAKQLLSRFPNAEIYNTYGPTEATVAVTFVKITEEVINKYSPLPIGAPKDDTIIYIMDELGNPLPEGSTGEIIIAGPSVSKGYLNNQLKTEAAYDQINGMNAYKTGDSGYFENGLLFYKGRIDFQIKLHGYRIEIEDIENNIRKLPLVHSAVVLPEMKDGKCINLHCLVVVKKHNFEKEYHLTRFLKEELTKFMPTYMIPRKFSYQSSLPMTTNGKVDRKKLLEQVYQ
ncbi:D-alanine--poly(phosphoribitol) ligase subunit DltA [Gottfriedia sp. NPDC056225]|uniref:D-alanine--poly(phosphoribitol) ligase subunit DltA n=1 Tax=Gottfriedia sp. NPDC056225 TaxID=3345751 RepID=UPI0035D68C21